jgi:hypothetical protein
MWLAGVLWQSLLMKRVFSFFCCREVQSEVYGLIQDWSLEEHARLRAEAPRSGLQTPHRGGTLQDVAKQVH